MYKFNTDPYSGFGEVVGLFQCCSCIDFHRRSSVTVVKRFYFCFLFEIMGRARRSTVFITWIMCSIMWGFLIFYPAKEILFAFYHPMGTLGFKTRIQVPCIPMRYAKNPTVLKIDYRFPMRYAREPYKLLLGLLVTRPTLRFSADPKAFYLVCVVLLFLNTLRSELVVILPDYDLRISLGTFSILLLTTTHVPLLVDKLSPRVLVG